MLQSHLVADRLPRPSDAAGGATTRTLERGLRILELLAEQAGDSGLGVTEVAAAAGLDKATALRLLQTLGTLGYAYRDPETKAYRLTGKLLGLSESFQSNLELPRRIRPFLTRLRDETGQTVHFGVREGTRVVYILKLESTSPVLIASAIGQSMPITTTSLGKAMLAAMSETDYERVLATLDFERRTEHSITDPRAFRQEIERTRARGFAIDDRENESSITCVGSALVDGTGTVVGAISVAGPSYVVEDRIEEFGRLCQGTAMTIRALL